MRAATLARLMLVATAVIAGLYFLYLIRAVLGALAIAIFLAVALGPAVDMMQRRRIPRGLAILACYVVMVLVVFGVGLLVVPPVVSEGDNFVREVPSYVDGLRNNPTLREYDDRYQITKELEGQASQLPSRLGDAASALQAVTVGVFSTIFQLVTILVMTFFLLLDGRRITRFVEGELGPERGPRFRTIAENVYQAVGGYVVGMALISLIGGVSTYVVLLILGVDFAVPLAVLMAFFVLIPLIGSSIAGVIIAIVCAISDFPTALIVWMIWIFVYQQVENNVLQPQIMRRTVQLPPLLVIVAVLIGASLLGVLGALLAIPVAAGIQIIVKDAYRLRKARGSEWVAADSAEEGRPAGGAVIPVPPPPLGAVLLGRRAPTRTDSVNSGAEDEPEPTAAPPDAPPPPAERRQRLRSRIGRKPPEA